MRLSMVPTIVHLPESQDPSPHIPFAIKYSTGAGFQVMSHIESTIKALTGQDPNLHVKQTINPLSRVGLQSRPILMKLCSHRSGRDTETSIRRTNMEQSGLGSQSPIQYAQSVTFSGDTGLHKVYPNSLSSGFGSKSYGSLEDKQISGCRSQDPAFMIDNQLAITRGLVF